MHHDLPRLLSGLMPAPFLACMMAAAVHQRLPSRLLPAIQRVEGGETGHVSANADGSVDIGLMQINSRWILPIAAMMHVQPAHVATRLALDPCFNISAAAMIVRRALDAERGDLMRAVGDYHSHTPLLNIDYQRRVVAAARSLQRGEIPNKKL